jgi:hypothetical protein
MTPVVLAISLINDIFSSQITEKVTQRRKRWSNCILAFTFALGDIRSVMDSHSHQIQVSRLLAYAGRTVLYELRNKVLWNPGIVLTYYVACPVASAMVGTSVAIA